MDVAEVIEAMKRDHRTCVWPGETLEPRPLLTRHAVPSVNVNFVTAHDLDEDTVDAAIREELAHAAALGGAFEWKLYSYDRPPDLRRRLEDNGFTIGEPEAVMIYDLLDGLSPFENVTAADVQPIEREEDLEDFRLASAEAFGKDFTPTTEALAEAIRNGDRGHKAYVAYLDGEPASVGRLYTSPSSLFAGLYGGGTRPQFRVRGLYRAVVAARAYAAKRLGARYLLVDARPTSQPILTRLGFTHVATTWPCDAPPLHVAERSPAQ